MTSHMLPAYARVDLAFERGEGVWLIATNGDRYLDFTGGVAVNVLGHAHPRLVSALVEQAGIERFLQSPYGPAVSRASAIVLKSGRAGVSRRNAWPMWSGTP